jgi:hypothetical protein
MWSKPVMAELNIEALQDLLFDFFPERVTRLERITCELIKAGHYASNGSDPGNLVSHAMRIDIEITACELEAQTLPDPHNTQAAPERSQ